MLAPWSPGAHAFEVGVLQGEFLRADSCGSARHWPPRGVGDASTIAL
jgi:hypothetical protein